MSKKNSQLAKPVTKKINSQPEAISITENLKQKVFPHIIQDFVKALKELNLGESIHFGQLGTFKKSQREVNGYVGYQYSFKAGSLLKK